MPQDMHPEDIKAAIRKKGSTIAELARANGMAKQNLSAAIICRSSEPAEKIIARFLGLSPKEIWPSRHDKKGRRISLRPGRKPAAKRSQSAA